MPHVDEIPPRLREHLLTWLGDWPPRPAGVTVVGSAARNQPGWDGAVHEVIGVASQEAALLSVPLEAVDAISALVRGNDLEEDLHLLRQGIAKAFGRDGRVGRGRFRWSTEPTATADVGDWVPTDDPRVPAWLKPFNDEVLIAWADDGTYGAGVGRKKHDPAGQEISVGTEESLRGRGIARKLVATAARQILDDGAIPTYLHAFDNIASDRVATTSGFPDVGWTILGFWPPEPDNV
jgi:GNAT superfamily N-acetyltransferase